MRKFLVGSLVIAGCVFFGSTLVSASADLAKIDIGGQRILEVVRRIGYWVILLKCITELIKAGMEGDTNSLGKIVMTYILIYGALFFVPFALRLVEGIF